MIETHEKIRYCCDCQRYQAGGIYDKCVIEVPLRDCVTGKRILSVRSAEEERSTGSCGLEARHFVPKEPKFKVTVVEGTETPAQIQTEIRRSFNGLELKDFAEKTYWQRLKARLWK